MFLPEKSPLPEKTETLHLIIFTKVEIIFSFNFDFIQLNLNLKITKLHKRQLVFVKKIKPISIDKK